MIVGMNSPGDASYAERAWDCFISGSLATLLADEPDGLDVSRVVGIVIARTGFCRRST